MSTYFIMIRKGRKSEQVTAFSTDSFIKANEILEKYRNNNPYKTFYMISVGGMKMKLNETNARYAVVRTAFHGGGVIRFHKSLEEALKTQKWYREGVCTCGCCAVVPVTEEARKEYWHKYLKHEYGDIFTIDEINLYSDLQCYNGNNHACAICR